MLGIFGDGDDDAEFGDHPTCREADLYKQKAAVRASFFLTPFHSRTHRSPPVR